MMKQWNLGIIGYWIIGPIVKLKRAWNLALVLQIVQTIPESYCSCLYLSIGQFW